MRRTNGARQGRNRKAGFRLSRISDAVLRRLDKQKCSSIYWASSKELLNRLSGRHNTSPIEVDREIRNAIKEAGIQMSAEEFIAMASKNVCLNLQRKQQM